MCSVGGGGSPSGHLSLLPSTSSSILTNTNTVEQEFYIVASMG